MAGAGDCTLGAMKRTGGTVVAACAAALIANALLIRDPPGRERERRGVRR